MYTLYWHPSSSSYAPMALLEETGAPYSTHEVDYDGGETRTSDYLRLQPLGLIPALGFSGGSSMFESGAIVMYICDLHRDVADLAPMTDEPERPAYLQWMFFLADTLYPAYNRFYWPARYTVTPEEASSVKEQARQMMLKQWQVVEDALADKGPWLPGQRFSACDIYLQMISTWHENPAELLDAFPRVRDVAQGVLARKACRRAFDRHNFASGLEDATMQATAI
jgi:glutathione S-transferase